MAFNPADLGTTSLYDPNIGGALTAPAWATLLANNINIYFIKGTAVPFNDGTFTYAHIPPLIGVPVGLIANLVLLYTPPGGADTATWGATLGGYIADWWATVAFVGTKVNNNSGVSIPWGGVVNSSIAKPVLIASLTPLYIPATAPPDTGAFASAISGAIDGAAKLCFLELPPILLL